MFPRIAILTVILFFSLSIVAEEPPAVVADREADLEALLQADRDFDSATAETGAEGWVSYFVEDGMMFGNDGSITQGAEAIREAMAPVFANPDFSLRWQPEAAEVSAAGDLGYTHGTYTLSRKDPEGEKVTLHGRYVTIWKKQADGRWKVALDIGTAPRPAPEPATR